ncbi:L,D-transpeptidase [Thioclava sp. BHET1]|nr:L,D-transpeptidase [Thioclava sp. BHET1]
MTHTRNIVGRRAFLTGAAAAGGAGLATPSLAQAIYDYTASTVEENAYTNKRRNISSFTARDWRPYFTSLRGGAILVDTVSRGLHYWSADQSIYKLYPTSVPISAELTRLGRTRVTRKVEGPSWAPTPSMKRRNPEWPDFVPPGPDNPLGTHALYLSWKYYRIHGTHDTRKIGRKSSNGCIGLYNEHIQELFALSDVGTQVLLI